MNTWTKMRDCLWTIIFPTPWQSTFCKIIRVGHGYHLVAQQYLRFWYPFKSLVLFTQAQIEYRNLNSMPLSLRVLVEQVHFVITSQQLRKCCHDYFCSTKKGPKINKKKKNPSLYYRRCRDSTYIRTNYTHVDSNIKFWPGIITDSQAFHKNKLKRQTRFQIKCSRHLTIFDNSLPFSIVCRHRGIISVARRKWITAVSSPWRKVTNIILRC